MSEQDDTERCLEEIMFDAKHEERLRKHVYFETMQPEWGFGFQGRIELNTDEEIGTRRQKSGERNATGRMILCID